ncbi:hypothetical protein [Ancylobacter pratisalsi]|uniref:hypothetical protein n=1 Tax=Ancylobacter pratisalsi TaxID=1745854 RepID=UPI001FEA8F32|nr:hypothetical protein [Ancylobacter pratisalsi]
MPAYNSEKGEVPLEIGGVELVIAATMGGLAQVSSKLGCQSFGELYMKLANVEINALLAGVECLTVRGDVGKAMKALTLRDLPACKTAFLAAMMLHADTPEGNAEAAGESMGQSPGGAGSNSPSAPSDGRPPSSGPRP